MRRPPVDTTTLAVLAGGAGSRMGRPKGMLEINGRPILAYLLDRIDWSGPTMLVTAPGRERPPGAERFDSEVRDDVEGEGPLRGVYTAITHATTPVVVVMAVDMPLVARADLEWFVKELSARLGAAGVMASRGGEIEPLPCALRPALALGLVSDHLASGRRALHGLAKDSEVKLADAGALPDRVWTNVNTPAEWERFVRSIPGDAPRG
jgi:molybdopterin-guanine dinucleotide biosynthesis protein A